MCDEALRTENRKLFAVFILMDLFASLYNDIVYELLNIYNNENDICTDSYI